ncbi:phage major capsid protein [Brucella sp. 10RB9214]|uniref:phage major capsid protein n=1 Tax=Brucella sp. 10RB9214 TaxID=1844040 RepID=UPI0012AEA3D6|nr:phage major capsid protein [Brucella sp. 10RB9214]MRN50924.1 phage major capsid protein [Brucella sp. 10RB9214]
MKFEHILTAFEAEPWAIQREKLAVLADVLAARVAGDKLVTPEFAAAVSDARAKEIAEIDGKVAVIPVYGVLADRMDLFSAMSGGTSYAGIKRQLHKALETTPVRTLAHIFKASRQILDDAPGLASYINARGTYGLKFVEEGQLLNGDGTGQNLHGILPQASAFAPAFTPENETAIDRLRLAILQVILAEYPASGFVLHPTDWTKIELTKDLGGNYIVGNAQSPIGPSLWNLPVVQTQAISAGKFLTGAFNLGAQIFDRMGVEVLLSSENDKDFENNMFTIRIEERLALAVYRPEAFVTGDVNPPVTP